MVVEPRPKVPMVVPPNEEDLQYMFHTSRSEDGGVDEMDNLKEKCQALERRLRAIKGNDVFCATAMDMCLVPDLVLPTKFKTLDFEKYKGHTCPKSHMIMYFRKMYAYSRTDKLLIHCFHDNLSGASLKWYMSLERTQIQNWVDLADAFKK